MRPLRLEASRLRLTSVCTKAIQLPLSVEVFVDQAGKEMMHDSVGALRIELALSALAFCISNFTNLGIVSTIQVL